MVRLQGLRAAAAACVVAVLLAACITPGPPSGGAGTSGVAADGSLGGAAGDQRAATGAGGPGGGSAHGGPSGASQGPSGMSGQPGGPGQGGPGGSMGGSSTGSAASSQGTGVKYTVSRAVHEAAWLCQTAVTVNDLTPAGTDGQQCLVQLSFTDTTLTVKSTGIPNHNFESGSGCCAKAQNSTHTFPLQPEIAKSATYPSQRGSIATAVNGVAIFGPEDSQGADVVIATYSDPSTQPRLAMCDAHSEPMSGVYHYHADGNCMHYHGSMSDYDFSKVDSTTHSKILGWAPDGFPIYGTYGYASDNVTIKEMTSSYRLKAGATGSNGQDDQEYVAGLGDLDECNGKTGPTPEFPSGIYHYYSTKHNGAGSWGFPYFPLCYRGVVPSSGGTGSGAGGGGGGSAGGGMGGSQSGSMSGAPRSGSGSQSGGPGGGGPPPPPGGGGGPPPPPH